MSTDVKCAACGKKFFEEKNLPLLLTKQQQVPGETPRIEVRCSRCKHLNVFVYEPSRYAFK